VRLVGYLKRSCNINYIVFRRK